MVELFNFGNVNLAVCDKCLGNLTQEKVPGKVGRCIHCGMPSHDVIREECAKFPKRVKKDPRPNVFVPTIYPSFEGVTDEISGQIAVGTRRKGKHYSS